jgi:xanthine dehydrogenase/oxidase
VTGCLRVKLNLVTQTVNDCQFAFGGMGPTTLMYVLRSLRQFCLFTTYFCSSKEAGKFCIGKRWSMDLFEPAADLMIKQDLFLPASAPGGMPEYRRALAASFLFKFILFVLSQINGDSIGNADLSAIEPKARPISQGAQVYVDSPYDFSIFQTII